METETNRVRFKIRRISDGKYLFPLKYNSIRSGYYRKKSGMVWGSVGRSYLTEKAARNEVDREIPEQTKKLVEIVEVKITEEIIKTVNKAVKQSFVEWIRTINN